jgi:hypothetical protein
LTRPTDFKQLSDLDATLADRSALTLGLDNLLGRWVNTNGETRGVAEFTIEHDGPRFTVRARGVGDGDAVHWPETEAVALANVGEEGGQRTIILVATFAFGFMRTETQIRVNKGVLVLVFFNTFLDGSGRSDYVTREFFYRPG